MANNDIYDTYLKMKISDWLKYRKGGHMECVPTNARKERRKSIWKGGD